MQQDRKLITEAGFDALHRQADQPEGIPATRCARCSRARAMSGATALAQSAGRRRHAAQREAARRPAGGQGLRASRRRPTARKRSPRVATDAPDLVLLDIMMPGLSGYDVCRRLRADAATALLPVVLVTSLDAQQERVKGIEAGADDFLDKPINQPELFARVRSLLRVKALQDEVRQTGGGAAGVEREARGARRRASGRARADVGAEALFCAGACATRSCRRATQSILAPHRREICYVFVDLRGFTAFTDAAEPEEVQAVLREYHATMGALISQYEGTLDRFAGDGILIFFNDPLAVPDAPRRAARDGARHAARSSRRCARAGRSSATSSISASASPKASRRSAHSATRAGSTTRRSAASSTLRRGFATRRGRGKS